MLLQTSTALQWTVWLYVNQNHTNPVLRRSQTWHNGLGCLLWHMQWWRLTEGRKIERNSRLLVVVIITIFSYYPFSGPDIEYYGCNEDWKKWRRTQRSIWDASDAWSWERSSNTFGTCTRRRIDTLTVDPYSQRNNTNERTNCCNRGAFELSVGRDRTEQ